MKNIKSILDKEKKLNDLCGFNAKQQDYDMINAEFEKLFKNEFYKKTHMWLDKDIELSLSDSYTYGFSQKKEANIYNISFVIDYITIYDENNVAVGYIKDSVFNIKSKDSLRDFSNKIILNFLIDEENKEIAFLYLKKGRRETISIKYDNVSFKKGIKFYYKNNENKKNKII